MRSKTYDEKQERRTDSSANFAEYRARHVIGISVGVKRCRAVSNEFREVLKDYRAVLKVFRVVLRISGGV